MAKPDYFLEGANAYRNNIVKCPYKGKSPEGNWTVRYVDWHSGWKSAAFEDQKKAFESGYEVGMKGAEKNNPYQDIDLGYGEEMTLTIPFECHKWWQAGYDLGHLGYIKNSLHADFSEAKERMDVIISLKDEYDECEKVSGEGYFKHGLRVIKARRRLGEMREFIKESEEWLRKYYISFYRTTENWSFCAIHSSEINKAEEMNRLLGWLATYELLTESEIKDWRHLFYSIYPGLREYPEN